MDLYVCMYTYFSLSTEVKDTHWRMRLGRGEAVSRQQETSGRVPKWAIETEGEPRYIKTLIISGGEGQKGGGKIR